jgi:hypothetical protein
MPKSADDDYWSQFGLPVSASLASPGLISYDDPTLAFELLSIRLPISVSSARSADFAELGGNTSLSFTTATTL